MSAEKIAKLVPEIGFYSYGNFERLRGLKKDFKFNINHLAFCCLKIYVSVRYIF